MQKGFQQCGFNAGRNEQRNADGSRVRLRCGREVGVVEHELGREGGRREVSGAAQIRHELKMHEQRQHARSDKVEGQKDRVDPRSSCGRNGSSSSSSSVPSSALCARVCC